MNKDRKKQFLQEMQENHKLGVEMQQRDRFAHGASHVLEIRAGRFKLAADSLKKMTLRCILENKEFFTDEMSNPTNPFNCISNLLKSELISFEAELVNAKAATQLVKVKDSECALQCRMMQKLLNNKMELLQFPVTAKRDCKEVTDLWKNLVAVNPENLKELVRRGACKHITWNLRPFFSHLLQFKSLQVLDLDHFPVDDSDLCKIATNLQELRMLKVNADETMSETGIAALSKLKHLQKFYFEDLNDFCEESYFYELCFQHLPGLSEVGFVIQRDFMLDYQEAHLCTYGYFMAMALEELEKPCQLGLQKMQLVGLRTIPDCVTLPNLKSYFVVNPKGPVTIDDRFSNVTELGLFKMPCMRECYSIFGRIGRQLTKLHLLVHSTIDVFKVLELCPNLRELSIYAQRLVSSSKLKPETLSKLRELNVLITNLAGDAVQPGLTLQLLQAPKLRSVALFSENEKYIIGLEELLAIVEEAKEKKILRRLQILKVECDVEEMNPNDREEYSYLFCRLVMNCPRLHTMTKDAISFTMLAFVTALTGIPGYLREPKPFDLV
ncbi:Hypothetical predicted protein [Cloeon dipterum]|uniref:Uncharacterized protein n=1 Tax=Cloeon dipterum TaxID=197152 RepID=A0A8S1BSH6_9INSE|nr:Hypothetical predicted protein [Cloeon dipterum]